jgi:hypothetical protein
MDQINQLEELYKGLSSANPIPLFVAPRIRFAYKKSDYLYLFYKNLLVSSDYSITDVSTLGHLKFVGYQLFKRKAILHYHWLEYTGFWSGFSFLFKLICIFLFCKLSGKLVWSVHNRMPPDCRGEWLNFRARRWMARHAHILLVECQTGIDELSTFFGVPETKFRVWPHPSYPPQLIPRAAAIEAINHRYDLHIKIQDRIFLMFGHISVYKQIEQVCHIFLNETIHKKLLIVGPVKKGQMKLYKRLWKMIKDHENIILIPQFIKEYSVPEFMNAADYVVFNYSDILTSGGVPLARSYDKTLILPAKGCLKEQKGKNLQFFKTQDELKKIIRGL